MKYLKLFEQEGWDPFGEESRIDEIKIGDRVMFINDDGVRKQINYPQMFHVYKVLDRTIHNGLDYLALKGISSGYWETKRFKKI